MISFKQYLLETKDYRLTNRNSPFGMRHPRTVSTIPMGMIPINAQLNTSLMEDLMEDKFPKDLPRPWTGESLLEVLSLLDGEFDIVMPAIGQFYNDRQIARGIMQLFEACGENKLYINKKDFPQRLSEYIPLVFWLKKYGIITSSTSFGNSSVENDGVFEVPSLLASLKDIQHLK